MKQPFESVVQAHGVTVRDTARHQHTDDVLTARTAPVESGTLAARHRRLKVAAQTAGLLDVAYTTVDSPVGRLLLAATTKGLVRVAYAIEDHDRVLDDLAATLSPRVLRAPGRLDAPARELDECFDHRRTSFDLKLDLSLSRGLSAFLVWAAFVPPIQ